uniref:HTH lacI-type domain-containing protein n=1 Tax=Yersinia enterocolitica W22703 TaxID=913028 RepID=F4MUA2_YEREN|nr:hypothetical protein YEW_KB43760 [Yersinia enterocolitica W22703]
MGFVSSLSLLPPLLGISPQISPLGVSSIEVTLVNPQSRRITRSDVARAAGTSVAVVSYVINNGPRPVAPATKQRVLDAIKKPATAPMRLPDH